MPATPAAEPWAAVRELFERLLPLPATERETGLAEPGLDAALVAEVRSLLAHESTERAGGFLLAGAPTPQATGLNAQGTHPRGSATAVAARGQREGQRLGPWCISSLLGRGGMGEVWLAERADGAFEGVAAIKVLMRGMDSAAVLARFAQEQQSLARLQHPHIARLLDAGRTDDGLPYFVMERVLGRPIDQACAGKPLGERLRLFLQLADAVSYAHRNLLVHRDLKPGNVMVADEGGVKLLDFGIAKALDPLEGGDATQTLAGERPFTPHFASPEQVRGEPVTTATDVYSLGVLLYLMLTGVRPTGRAAATPGDAVRAVLAEQPTPPSQLEAGRAGEPQWPQWRRQLAGDIDHVLMRALEKSVDRRYASVDALAVDLHSYLEGRPIAGRAAVPLYVLGKFLRRNRWAVLAASMGAIGLVTGLAATVLQGHLAVALGLVGLATGLGLALVQGRRAELARARAEQHVAELRKLSREVVVQYGDAITYVPGGKERKAAMLASTVAHLERLAESAPHERGLKAELGTMHSRLADLRSTREYNASEDLQAAEHHAVRAVALCAAAEREPVHDATLYRWWARALGVLAEAAQERSQDLPRALALLREADAVLERGLARHPASETLTRTRADNLLQIFEVHYGWNKPSLGQPDLALEAAEAARPLYERGARAGDRAHAYDTFQLGTLDGGRALVFARLERWDEARAAAATARGYEKTALELDPHNDMYRGGYAAGLNMLGGLHLNLGDAADALPHTTRSWQLLDELQAREPEHATWRLQRQSLAFNHGRALLGVGEAAAAGPVLQVSADWLGPRAARGEATPVQRRRLALTRLAQAEVLRALEQPGGAALVDEAVALLQGLLTEQPQDREAWMALGEVAAARASWCTEAEQGAWLRRAVEAYAHAEAERPLTALHAHLATRVRGQVGS